MDISNKKIAIVTHELVYGAPQALKDYCLGRNVSNLLFLAHPLVEKEGGNSYYEIYLSGQKETIFKKTITKASAPFLYLWQFIYTIIWVYQSSVRYDYFIGADPLNALSGIILRCMGRTEKVIYYTIDFVPVRFKNKIINSFYHWVDKLCVIFANETWNVSPRIEEGRKKILRMDGRLYRRQKVVPIGVWFDKVKRLPFQNIKKNQILFLGNLLEKQGVQLVISIIPELIKKIPDFHFLVVGDGDYRPSLEKLVQDSQLSKHVTFTGWIKDRQIIDTIMADSAMAMALYDGKKDNFTYYADPTKLKDYLSAGLPILLTDVPHNAKDIEAHRCGIIVPYEKEALKNAILSLMDNEGELEQFRTNAISYSASFDWHKIFDEALCPLV